MIRRWSARSSSGRRGQATAELALILPVVAGLFAMALQGGLLISDQLNLEHFAYDGAQWAAINLGTQDLSAIGSHVIAEMCDGGTTYAGRGANATKFCTSTVGNDVSVTAVSTPTTMVPPNPTSQVLGLHSCKSWSLSVTPSGGNQNPAPAGSTLNFNIAVVIGAGTTAPVISLSVTNYPPNTTPGPPLFNPPTLTSLQTTSTLSFTTSSSTPPGTYTMDVSGVDQCGGGPNNGDQQVDVTTSGAATPTPSPCGNPPQILQVVNAQGVSGSITSVTILGQNFVSGSTVKFGGTAAAAVSFVSATQLVVTLPVGLPAGAVYNVTVTTPANCVVTSNNAFTLCLTVCPTPGSNIPAAAARNPCASSNSPNHYQTAIVISWREPLFIPWISPAVTLVATQYVFCQ